MLALHAGTLACCMLHVAGCMLQLQLQLHGGSCSDRVTLQPITCFIIGPSKRKLAQAGGGGGGAFMRHMDANFIGLFSHSHSHSHSTGAHAMPVLGPEFGIKCQKVTRRVASTRKLCNILLNVSISVTLSSDLAQTVAVFSGKFRLLFWGLACHADRPVTATATATLKGISRATTMTDSDGKWPPALTASF